MEAYRRLAAVTSAEDVDDVRAEWQDRYGPPPPPAAALLDVARLRAACLRLGIGAVSVQKGRARLDGWHLRKSQEVRLQRMVARAQVLPDAVVVPIAASGEMSVAQALLVLLDTISPPEAADAGAPPTGESEASQVPSAR
jgi:transcription-repair coupling factor (superfamily II helicase)